MLPGNHQWTMISKQQFLEQEHNSQAMALANSILNLSTDPNMNHDFIRYYSLKIAHEVFQKPMFEETIKGVSDTKEIYESIQYDYRVDVINRLQAMLP